VTEEPKPVGSGLTIRKLLCERNTAVFHSFTRIDLWLCWLLGTSVRKTRRFLRTDVPRSQHRSFPRSKASGPRKRHSALRPRPSDLFSTRERSRWGARDTPVHGNPHSAGEHEPMTQGAFRFQGLLRSGARLWDLDPVRSIPERHLAPLAPAPSVPRAGLLAPLAGAACISLMVLASHLLLPRKRDPSSTPCRLVPTHARSGQHRPERSRKRSCSSITFL
jgi:hypothetical protein